MPSTSSRSRALHPVPVVGFQPHTSRWHVSFHLFALLLHHVGTYRRPIHQAAVMFSKRTKSEGIMGRKKIDHLLWLHFSHRTLVRLPLKDELLAPRTALIAIAPSLNYFAHYSFIHSCYSPSLWDWLKTRKLNEWWIGIRFWEVGTRRIAEFGVEKYRRENYYGFFWFPVLVPLSVTNRWATTERSLKFSG